MTATVTDTWYKPSDPTFRPEGWLRFRDPNPRRDVRLPPDKFVTRGSVDVRFDVPGTFQVRVDIPGWIGGSTWYDITVPRHGLVVLNDLIEANTNLPSSLPGDGVVSVRDERFAQPDPQTVDPSADGFNPCEILANGFTTVPRVGAFANFAPSSGQLRLSYFTAPITKACSGITVTTGTTAAGATPTLIKFGVWLVDAAGDMTLVAATPHDAALLAAANTAYTKAFSSRYTFVAGQRYAWAPLVVTAAAMPNFGGVGGVNNSAEASTAPRSSGLVTGQTDLPATIGNAVPVGSAIGQAYARFA